MRYVLDIETNGLVKDMCTFKEFPYKLRNDAKIWVVSLFNIDTEKQYTLVNEAITKDAVSEILKDCTELIAHNGFKFDFPILEMFGLITYTIDSQGNSTLNGNPCKFIDTLIWSRLFYPDRFGGHSLKAWGDKISLPKIDYRLTLINKGKLTKDSPKGAEFLSFFPEMEEYCNNDVEVCCLIYQELLKESENKVWQKALKQENYLAHLSFYRENFGFGFNKELALNNLERLIAEMNSIQGKINPILPSRKLNKTEQKEFIPPKKQILKDGKLTKNIAAFAEKHKADIRLGDAGQWVFHYKDVKYDIPFSHPLETEIEGDIDNLDHVKMYLISLGWEPTEWRERDMTKDSKKQNLPIQKRVAVLDRWWEETINGKYKKQRLEYLDADEHELYFILKGKLSGSKPVKVPTSPLIRVGVTKELCPNLIKLGEKVAFAKDFADYLTYKHRKSCIAGGDIDEMDFDEESPNTGYLSSYREEDGRISTPAIEIGAASFRYKHISVANVPRVTSLFGEEMRSLFTPGEGFIQFGWDYSSLEARIMGHYVYKYDGGVEMADMLLAEKPLDWHSQSALKVGINRNEMKSLNYGLIYGAQPSKIQKMLACTNSRAKEIYNDAWDAMPALKELKSNLEEFWEKTGKKYIIGIDGRKIFTRSKHSLLNFLFQSAGVICTKYVFNDIFTQFQEKGLNISPFKGMPDVISMIEYHDECQFATKDFYRGKYQLFSTEEEAKEFVKSWTGGQLSAIGHEKDFFYIVKPNLISETIINSLDTITKKFDLKVPLSMEYNIGMSWAQCH